MTMTLKFIKKLMGWCPNAKTVEVRSRISPANFEEYDQSKGEKSRNPKVTSLFSRLYIRFFLPTFFLTPIYIVMLFLKGVNLDFFFLGILFSLLINSLFWEKQIREYNAAAKKPTVRYVSKIVLFFVFLSLIWFLILPPLVFLSYTPPSVNSQSMYSFIAGAWILTMWGTCLQLFYWEKKNHMKVCIMNENGFQKTYNVAEKE